MTDLDVKIASLRADPNMPPVVWETRPRGRVVRVPARLEWIMTLLRTVCERP